MDVRTVRVRNAICAQSAETFMGTSSEAVRLTRARTGGITAFVIGGDVSWNGGGHEALEEMDDSNHQLSSRYSADVSVRARHVHL